MVNELPTRLDMGNFPDVIRYLQNQLRDHGRQGSTDMEALDSQFLNVAEEGGEAAGAYRRWRGFARRSGTKEEVLAELADCIISAAVGMIYFCDIADAGAPSVVIQDTLARKLHKIFVRGYVNKEAKPTAAHPGTTAFYEAMERDAANALLDDGTTHKVPLPNALDPDPTAEDYARNRAGYAVQPPGNAVYDGMGREVRLPGLPPNPTTEPSAHRNALDAQAAIRLKDNPDAVYVRQPDGTWEYAGQIDSFDFLGLVPPYTITTGRDFCGPFKP